MPREPQDDVDPEVDAARRAAQMDQAHASFRGIGRGLAALNAELREEIGRREARRITRDVAHQWAQGTFNRQPGITLPGFGDR